MHYLLVDMLAASDIPFITEKEMIVEESALLTLFEGKTPDLIIKSGGANRPKPLIVDLQVGQTEEAMFEKKAIYATMEVIFDFTSLTLYNYKAHLLLSPTWITSTVNLPSSRRNTSTGMVV